MSVPAHVRLHWIAEGNAGIRQTLDRMRALMHAAAGSPWVAWATSQVPAGPPLAVIGQTYEWVLRRLRYVYDGQASDSVPQDEEIRAPEYLLAQIAQTGQAEGDCDDFVVLLGALLRARGIPARMVVTSARDDQEFDHVYLEAFDGRRWWALDGIHGAPLGWSVPVEAVTNRERWPV